MNTRTKCLIKNCGKPVGSRGLCASCYSSAKDLINQKKTSWEDLERLGLALPSERKRNAFRTAFSSAYQTHKKEPKS